LAFREEIAAKDLWLSVHSEDFFPMEEIYRDSFWTGYYTSRANSKKAIREFSQLTYLSNTLYAFERFRGLNDSFDQKLAQGDDLSWQLGLLMHHDTITGTSYQYVNDDYMDQISNIT
jgi:hypothetical protein